MPTGTAYNLINLKEYIPDLLFDIRYATKNNFTENEVYISTNCYLHIDAAEKLLKANTFAQKLGYKIKIFDAFRPQEAQEILWKHTPDDNFLANPERGSPHSRGVAVDLTLVDTENMEELEMGTEFDAFTPHSYHSEVEEISNKAIKNRLLLLGIMTASGFDHYRNEWWHYQLFGSKKYSLINDKEAKTGLIFKT